MRLLTLILLALVAWANAQSEYPAWINGTFPDDFEWGLATASYQVEGAWNQYGKGLNIWDTFTHQAVSPIVDGSNGDVACDSYHRYQVDVQLLKNMGVHFYRFSVSWARVLPTGAINNINQAGIDYYNNLINDLIANGIEPMITIYHWDLPQSLQDANGWQNPTIIDEYMNYADLLFRNFGDRVTRWITFNEPWVTCVMGYGNGEHAPGIKDQASTAPYLCAHNLLRSHARAYRLYESNYKDVQHGTVGITLDSAFYTAKDPDNADDVEAAKRAVLFKHGWFADPIFSMTGDYPQVMRDLIDSKSTQDGTPSRLPRFTDEEKIMINGSSDFLGFNHYTTQLVESEVRDVRSWDGDQNTRTSHDPTWPASASSWLKHVPWGFRGLLNYFKDTYNNPVVYVTENGFSDSETVMVNDDGRVLYYREYINEMLKAVTLDGCNVKAYTAWSLIDNFEWARGYTERFGIHWVNMTHPDRPRVPKKSAILLKQIFADNGFPSTSTKLVAGLITSVFAILAFMLGRLF